MHKIKFPYDHRRVPAKIKPGPRIRTRKSITIVWVSLWLAFTGLPGAAQVITFQSAASGGTVSDQATNATLVHFGMAGGVVASPPNMTGFFYGYGTPGHAGPPVITDFSPSSATPGTEVIISGANFSSVKEEIEVKINGTTAPVLTSSPSSITISVPDGATTGKISVTVNGVTAVSTGNFTVSQESASIVISANTTPLSVAKGTTAAAGVTVTDPESGIEQVMISYRGAASGKPFSAPVSMSADDNVYTYSIPASAMDELGTEYQITATNGEGLTRTTSGLIRVYHPGDGLTIPYSAYGSAVSNYRIVSVPLDLDAKTMEDVFTDDHGPYNPKEWRMYHYTGDNNSELKGVSPIEPGKGYWLIVKHGPVAVDSGPGVTVQATLGSPFSMPLNNGWTQIGNPYNYDLSWADVQSANAGLGSLRIYNGDFADGTVLPKMGGGFVFSSEAGTLVFPVKKNNAPGGRLKKPLSDVNAKHWELMFELSQGSATNRTSGLGMADLASEGYDVLDGVNMPRFFDEYLELKHEKQISGFSLSKDVVPFSPNHTWTFAIESYRPEKPVTLKWESPDFESPNVALVLWDITRNTAVNMKEKNSYHLSTGAGNFKVIYGAKDYVTRETEVTKFALHPAFPNPSSGDITLAFTLPRPGEVNIKVMHLTGGTAFETRGNFTAGYHEMVWERQRGIEAGVYIVIVQCRNEVKHEKILLK